MKDIYDFRTAGLEKDIQARWAFAAKIDTREGWFAVAHFIACIVYLARHPYSKVGGSIQARRVTHLNLRFLESVAEHRADLAPNL